MMREFLKKTWIFFLVAAVVAGSTILLSVSIDLAQAAGRNNVMQVETLQMEIPPSAPPMEIGDGFVMPEFLLVFDPQASEIPTAKDITAQQAAETAAKMLVQIFDAELNGEVCETMFYTMTSVGLSNRGMWQVIFGDTMFVGGATIDSVSGTVHNLWGRVGISVDGGREMEIDDAEYATYVQDCVAQATSIAEQYFLDGGDVYGVDTGSFEADYARDTGSWSTVRMFLSSGMCIDFGFVREEGGVSTIDFYSREDVDAMRQAELVAKSDAAPAVEPAAQPSAAFASEVEVMPILSSPHTTARRWSACSRGVIAANSRS